MVKAVFFDLVNTLVRHDPPPEERQQLALRRFGIDIPRTDLRRGFWAANDYFSWESSQSPVEKRPPQDKLEVFVEFERTWLREAGVEVTRELALELLHLMRSENPGVVPFDDAVPALTELRHRGLSVGLVSNLDTTLERFCPGFDLASHLDFVIVSHEVGFEKPHQEIFEAALKRSRAEAAEVIMVGDQYHTDIAGALRAGLTPLWLDRDGVFEDHVDCKRISTLTEIIEYI
ncbi:MAG: HAD family hydrolase [Dehalococcoidia bacterium]